MMDSDRFRQAMRLYASGVCIIATGSGEARRGLTVSAISSVSADPPMVLGCINRRSSSHDAITSGKRFSVNILSSDQHDVAMAFAGATNLGGHQRFSVGSWSNAEVPVLDTALQTLICEPASCCSAGSHTILIGRVIETLGIGFGNALVNFDGAMREVASPRFQPA